MCFVLNIFRYTTQITKHQLQMTKNHLIEHLIPPQCKFFKSLPPPTHKVRAHPRTAGPPPKPRGAAARAKKKTREKKMAAACHHQELVDAASPASAAAAQDNSPDDDAPDAAPLLP